MNAKQFLDLYGKERAQEVAEKAGTSYAYFNQIAYGHRWPSVKKAQALVAASDGDLDLMSLLTFNRKTA